MKARTARCRLRGILAAGAYVGFVLYGFDLSALDQHGRVVRALDAASFAEAVGKLTSHGDALEAVAGILRDLSVNPDEEVVPGAKKLSHGDFFKSSWMVMVEIHRRRDDLTPDIIAKLRSYLLDIRFEAEPDVIAFDFDSMKDFLSLTAAKKRVFPDDDRARFNLKAWNLSMDITLINLCVFGGSAPSPFWKNGRRVNIGSGDDDPALKQVDFVTGVVNGIASKEKRAPVEFLAFSRVPVDRAAQDWNTLINGGYIVVPSKRLSAKESMGTLIIQEDLKKWWKVLQAFRKVSSVQAPVIEGLSSLGVVDTESIEDMYA
jgi:hypothetical protein